MMTESCSSMRAVKARTAKCSSSIRTWTGPSMQRPSRVRSTSAMPLLDWFEKNTPKEPSGIDSLNHAHSPIPPQKDLNLICNSVRSDLEERGIQTLDRADGKMGFVVDQKYKQDVIKAVEARFPGLTPEELGIEFSMMGATTRRTRQLRPGNRRLPRHGRQRPPRSTRTSNRMMAWIPTPRR